MSFVIKRTREALKLPPVENPNQKDNNLLDDPFGSTTSSNTNPVTVPIPVPNPPSNGSATGLAIRQHPHGLIDMM